MEDEFRKSCLVVDDMSSNEVSPVWKIIREIETGKYKKIVVLNGAGISEAPDFVTLREEYDTNELFTLQGYLSNRSTVDKMLKTFQDAPPTPYHSMLKKLADKGYLEAVYTQNIDGIEKKIVGSDYVFEMHGNLESWKCAECQYEMPPFEDECECCRGDTRPNIVFYDESVKFLELAKRDVAKCDMLLIAGTSLQVAPVNRLPYYAPPQATILVVDKAPDRGVIDNLPPRPVVVAQVETSTFASKLFSN